ncbi:MAG: UDP-N-acetylglucosamine pyrophosphorylase [Calditrichaeota bacterium]|nr:MAG: UDP-N-acetylglucosamine pyrophosphorylase [Calditrichota bacterium]MBL1204711.1 UDP-N-acetylglucosamine pyrophosphorylase [Calditrichota bacterium]NOG44539.1 NTP transferase domain-containing protein [Calditrichota bacterium]
MKKISTAIMAAGKGTRMKSDLPKVLHKLNDRSMVHYVIDLAEKINSDKIVLIVGHKKELLEDECSKRNVEFAVQSPQLGTGHAVQMTESAFNNYDGDVLVLSGDVPLLTEKSIRALITEHHKSDATATLLTADLDDPFGYGRVVRDKDGSVESIVEHKDANEAQLKINEINVGIYLFDSKKLFDALKAVKNDNSQGEYYLPDVVPMFIEEGLTVRAVKSESFDETRGINTIDQLKEAETILNTRS